jgi:hypothetical protein
MGGESEKHLGQNPKAVVEQLSGSVGQGRVSDQWEGAGSPSASEKPNIDDVSQLRPIAEIYDLVGLSAVRIRALLHDNKIPGEKRRQGRGPGKWFTSIAAVREYQANLPSSAEFGRMGGRPKKTIDS